MATEIRDELYQGLKEIRDEIGSTVLLEYSTGERGTVPAIVYSTDYSIDGMSFESKLRVNILIRDLQDKGLAVKGFSHVTWKLQKYVAKANPLSSFEEVIVLDCSIFG